METAVYLATHFYTPTSRDAPPTSRDAPPTARIIPREVPPTPREAPPTPRDAPPTLRDAPPTPRDAPKSSLNIYQIPKNFDSTPQGTHHLSSSTSSTSTSSHPPLSNYTDNCRLKKSPAPLPSHLHPLPPPKSSEHEDDVEYEEMRSIGARTHISSQSRGKRRVPPHKSHSADNFNESQGGGGGGGGGR